MGNPSTMDPKRFAKLREICLSLPEVVETEKHGDPAWDVRGKGFCSQKGNFDGGRPSLWFKSGKEDQAALVGSEPDRFFVPPYVGGKGWTALYLDSTTIDWQELRELIEDAYRLQAPKRLAARI